MKRPDWVIFPIAGPMVPMSAPSAPKGVAKPAAESKETPPAEPGQKKYPAAGKSIEERLMILNDLRNKKLITDEEYRVKRLEILNEL